jgi:Insertion element 4 transposase N-terminal
MDGQGCSDPVSGINPRISDRIAGLEKIVTPTLIERALAITGMQTKRECTLSNEGMILVVLALGLFPISPSAWSTKLAAGCAAENHLPPGRACAWRVIALAVNR